MRQLWIAYLLLVLLIALIVGNEAPNSIGSYHAARLLAPNHRIVKTDLEFQCALCRILDPDLPTEREFEGRYVKDRHDPKSAIALSDTIAQPVFSSHTGDLLAWLAAGDAATAELSAIDVGATVEACGFGDPKNLCIPALKVAAVSCDEKQPPACAVGVWIAKTTKPSALAAIAAAAKPNAAQRLHFFVER